MKTRPSAIILADNKLLTLKYNYHGNLLYAIPGGNLEFGEKQIPHITASIPSNLSPSICNGFLNNNINSGIIIQEIDYDILLKGYNQFP